MEPTNSEVWKDFGILVLYCLFALFTMYLITGPPLERWLRRRRPEIAPDELQRRRDWLMFLWAIVNLIVLIIWWNRLLAIGTV